ncbi:uncharacterized protein LOC122665644 [Telopea speciosissima]|uniref:uncharacterized protein LOC122665644 n=1 Tax=Telopea speciosissima TaxID=54955 RepID=UPI001CC6FC94|nr:uncharacterized protein LOC122665644 [Telopea speciosissima]
MSRSWIDNSREPSFRVSTLYIQEVNNFLDYAFSNAAIGDEILCPCVKCINQLWKTRDEVFEHLICDGFLRSYTIWSFHGEDVSSHTPPLVSPILHDEGDMDDGTRNMLSEMWRRNVHEGHGDGATSEQTKGRSVEAEKFDQLLEDAEKELYPGSIKFTKLSFLIRLYHIKCLCKLSDKAFSMLLDLLKEAFPEPNSLPKTLYEAKKIVKDLGLTYNKIDACKNDCMLYWKEATNAKFCYKCGTSRYTSEDKKIPIKILRHFPLIPRLQRLYMSSKIASKTRWHQKQRTDDKRL